MRLTANTTESQYAEAFTIACKLAATKVIGQVDAEREKYGFWPLTLEAAAKEIQFLKMRLSIYEGKGAMDCNSGSPTGQACLRIVR